MAQSFDHRTLTGVLLPDLGGCRLSGSASWLGWGVGVGGVRCGGVLGGCFGLG